MDTSDEPIRPVLVIGAATVDAKAIASEPLSRGGSVPGRIRLSPGGVARNIAECLARLEVPAALLSAVGTDSLSEYILGVTAAAGVDVSPTLRAPDARGSAFFALLEPDGTRAFAIDDISALAALTSEQILAREALFLSARAVVLDNNLPQETVATIVEICKQNRIPICADPTSTYLAPRLSPFLSSIDLITPNQQEASILCQCPVDSVDDALKAAKSLVRKGVRMALLTMGDMGVVYATASESGHVRAPEVEIVDLTGGSDAMTATVVYALAHDFPVDEAVRLAVTAAALTITTQDTVRSDLSLELLYDSMLV